MAVGIAMLAHARLDRAGAVAAHLAGQGAAVAVHVDPRASGAEDLRRLGEVTVLSRHAAEWGRFGMVAATLATVRALLSARSDLSHVCLISGACLPLRPLAELEDKLASHPGTDFIESVPLSRDQWVEDGLSLERFTLHHPFSHRHSPRLFSASVEVQRALRVRRHLPAGVIPHLGGQWWCLSVGTLRAILDHPDLPRWERFFRSTWIPDESFFQSLVRTVRPEAEPRTNLHLGAFNRRGRPHVFHDDHAGLLAGSDRFFARKIDPDAGALYDRFLGTQAAASPARCLAGKAFAQARAEREGEGRGLATPARLPRGTRLTRAETARPYLVLACEDPADVQALLPALAQATGVHLHGRLFDPAAPAAFAVPGETYTGNLPGAAAFRDYRAPQFLSRIVWADRDRGTAFVLAPGDERLVRLHLLQDPNARLLLVGGDTEARLSALVDAAPRVPRSVWVRPCEPILEDLSEAVASDWSDPAGWDVPS